ncbi:unnamed protein product [Cladocopium goreaui]|uniref:Uncharacterized protein n=1 Tax=Cladocopium goreaui TaxID=2562237 RepID=A0A9P1C894_9DINO|nr:unnamed protein product [Cladocopium goreaui]
MGAAEPHRRKPGQTSAFTMSADICGPFKDFGVSKRRKVRYALHTFCKALLRLPPVHHPVPLDSAILALGSPWKVYRKVVLPRTLLEGGAPVEAKMDDLFGPEEPKELISVEAARKRNQKWVEAIKKEAQELSEPVPVVNLTFLEPIASRAADEIVTALSKIHAATPEA